MIHQIPHKIRRTVAVLQNEEGAAIIAVMLILVVLTIVGIASTNVSNTEVQIAGSHAVYQQNFYLAEGAATAGVEALEDATDDPRAISGSDNATGILNVNEITANLSSSAVDSNINASNHTTAYYIDYVGVSPGSSLGVTSSKVHEFSVYGRSEVDAGPNRRSTAVVNIGYLMAF